MFDIELDEQGKELIVRMERGSKKLREAIVRILKIEGKNQTNYIIKRHLTGGTSKDRLRTRSGLLKKTTIPLKVREQGNFLIGGTQFGVDYARVHVGEPGQEMVMRPSGTSKKTGKKNKWLTIPLKPALTGAGVMKHPSAADFPNLSFVPLRKDTALLVQKRKRNVTYTKGKKTKLKPFFVLKKEVKIKTRIFPSIILKTRKDEVMKNFRNGLIEIFKDKT
jgi:hypothetical protein